MSDPDLCVMIASRYLCRSAVRSQRNTAALGRHEGAVMTSGARFRGSITALVTPFRSGAFDEAAFRALVDWQIESGTHGFVPVGTTGEGPTLSHVEHRRVVEACVKETRGRAPVIAGAGSNSTAEAMDLARYAETVGADGVLVVTPYYNKPSQEGMYHHFKTINDAVGIPIIIYNIPPRSVVDMSIDTMKRLYELKNVVGVKDATASLARTAMQRSVLGPDFIQLSGEDMTALAVMAHGGHGCISVTSNVAPRQCADMQDACLAGDFKTALRIQDKLTPLHAALFAEPNPAGPKAALVELGRIADEVRLPMLPASETARALLRQAMVHASLLN